MPGPGYVAGNILKNLVAPVVLPLVPRRGCLGMDGDLDRVLATLEWLAEGLEPLDVTLEGTTVAELGPGRTAEILGALVLGGAQRGIGVDVQLQLPPGSGDPGHYMALAERLAHADPFLAAIASSREQVARRMEELARNEWPVEVRTFDGVHLPLADASVDLLVSKSVLEHVPRRDVAPLLEEMHRILTPSGAMVHVVDLRDHMWIVGDEEVTGDWLDALRYSERTFNAMFSRRSTRINRLRAPEWRALLEESGFSVEAWEERPLDLPAGFDRRRLAEPWRSFDDDSLRVGHVCVAARPR